MLLPHLYPLSFFVCVNVTMNMDVIQILNALPTFDENKEDINQVRIITRY